MADDLKKLAEAAAPMADVEKVARAICRAAGLDPDAVAMVEVKLGREPVRTLRWQVHIPQAEAAIAAMGEREAVAIRSSAEPPAPTPLTPSIPNQR